MSRVYFLILVFLGIVVQIDAKSKDILGAGATFPFPLYAKMFHDYHKESGDRINYQAIGSGGGVRQIQNKTVDFGATDAFVSNKGLKKFDSEVLHIPTCIGAVVLTYNLPGHPNIVLSGGLISDIFLGKITRWDDPKIVALNPGVQLPKLMIAVIHRSDGSGTSYIFTDYLSKVSPEWKRTVGVGKSVNWPAGLGGKGNPGVAALVKQIPGSVGYVELVYTIQNKIPVADIINRSGRRITPSIGSVSSAVPSVIPDDMRVLITDTSSPNGYPISSFTWILVYKEQAYLRRNIGEAHALQRMLKWVVSNSRRYAGELGYSPVPDPTVARALTVINEMKFKGKPINERSL